MNFELPLLSFALGKKNEPLHIEKVSEEKNDNLLDTDGNLENNSIENKQSETEILEEIVAVETSDSASVEQVEETIETGSVLRRLLCLSL